MSTSYVSYPPKGVPIFPSAVNFPASAQIGSLAVAADTGGLYEWRGSSWVLLADPAVSPLAIDALTGDVSATGPGVVAATVNSVGGATAANIASATGQVIADAFLRRNGSNSPTANINWGGFQIKNLLDPTLAQDAATKAYVDAAGGAFANKTLSNLTSPTAINQDLLFGVDNTNNIGASLASRPASVFVGTQVIVPLVMGNPASGALLLAGGASTGAGAGGTTTVRGGAASATVASAGGIASLLGADGTTTGSGGAGGNAVVAAGNANGDNTVSRSGGNLSANAGNSKGSATGGTVVVLSGTGGNGTGTAGSAGGLLSLTAGTGGTGSSTGGLGGASSLSGGAGTLARTGGAVTVQGGLSGTSPGATGGAATIQGRNSSATGSGGPGGQLNLLAGNASGDGSAARSGGLIQIVAGAATGAGSGGNVAIQSGSAPDTAGVGGDIRLNAQSGGAGGTDGSIVFALANTDVGFFLPTPEFQLDVDLTFTTDGTHNIGRTGNVNRPGAVYVANQVQVGDISGDFVQLSPGDITGSTSGLTFDLTGNQLLLDIVTMQSNAGTSFFIESDGAVTNRLDWNDDGSFTFTGGALDVSGNFIHNVTDPVSPQDAATKAYVDAATGSSVTNPGAYPYTVLPADQIVQVDTSAARTINLPPATSFSTGKPLYIKDHTGNGTTNAITVVPNGAETIDGMASASITVDWGVMRLYSDGSNWFSL